VKFLGDALYSNIGRIADQCVYLGPSQIAENVPKQPTLETPRLILRPLELSDAKDVQRLAGEPEIARTTLAIPHPYPDGVAEQYLATLTEKFNQRNEVNFAVTRIHSGELIGAACLRLELEHDRGEVGYWIGKPFCGQGYATEAARAIVDYGFQTWGLNRIEGGLFSTNPASGRVQEKLGFRPEGRLRQYIKKWGEYVDLEIRAVLRSEWRP
jgi:[ribosomal protein S5]-alanine N-acetyltransferase